MRTSFESAVVVDVSERQAISFGVGYGERRKPVRYLRALQRYLNRRIYQSIYVYAAKEHSNYYITARIMVTIGMLVPRYECPGRKLPLPHILYQWATHRENMPHQ